jgi:acyl dehydratase
MGTIAFEDAAKRSVLGGVCASGWFTVCLGMRTYVETVPFTGMFSTRG